MSITIKPIPIPKIQRPRGVYGDVTMSVAIKMAPKRRPPARSSKMGLAPVKKLIAITVPSTPRVMR
jgi:hypothetical protein